MMIKHCKLKSKIFRIPKKKKATRITLSKSFLKPVLNQCHFFI